MRRLEWHSNFVYASIVRLHCENKDRLCSKCGMHQVADERHILLVCPATAAARARFTPVLRWRPSLQAFIYNNRAAWKELAEFVRVALAAYGWLPLS